jgi:hypothetical protein
LPWAALYGRDSDQKRTETHSMTTTSLGAEALNSAHAFLGRFAAFPSAQAHDAVTLWCAHTWAVNAFNASPRLAVLSDLPASGKSRVLELVAMLSRNATIEIDLTGPALVAMMSQRQPTVILDESDMIFGSNGGDSHRALRAVINGGYRAGATVTRRSGGQFKRETIYGALAFGGLGVLPGPTMSRCIVVRMLPRKPEQRLQAFMPRTHKPQGESVGEALGSWVASVKVELESAWPTLPDGIEDRRAELWECICTLGDLAGNGWAERAREACTALALEAVTEPTATPERRLLGDLRTVWGDSANLATAEIVRELYALEGSPWAKLWGPANAPRELAALLAPYGVRPVKVRVGDRTAQGYRRSDLEPHWEVPNVPELQHQTDLIGV